MNMGKDTTNRKPYRTKAQKQEARQTASRQADGAYRSNAPVSYHTEKCSAHLCVCRSS